jgi:CBS domain-containing protein
MLQTSVKDLMRKDPIIISPDSTLKEAAEKMASIKCGALPVGTPDKLEGVITDRDIVVRAVAKGKDTGRELVRDYMTPEVHTCKMDDTADRAAGIMRDKGVSRIIVEDENGKPCGILTFGSIVRKSDSMHEIATVIECALGRKAA